MTGDAEAALVRIDPARAPITVLDVSLDEARVRAVDGSPVPDRLSKGPVLALVRLHRRPIGVVCAELPGDGASAATATGELLQAARRQLSSSIAAHAASDLALGTDGAKLACDRARDIRLSDPPLVSVIVATRGRAPMLARCLDSLMRLDYPRAEIIVVDNDPQDTETEDVVAGYGDKVRYTVERVRGLASAHNRGLAVASGSILAFTDDDVLVDPDWASALVEAFRSTPRAGCVTGLIMPAELENRPQAMLERRGGFAKGFRLVEHHAASPDAHPLFPFTAGRLGSGANMAFTADALRSIGGFDATLGAGTSARGGDDLLAFFRTAASGYSVVYQPDALVWHHHRRTPEALDAQAYGYGVGLGAYLTAAVVHEPQLIPGLLRRLPRGAAYALRNSRPDAADPESWPARLARLERYGLCYGPIAYGRSRWESRRAGRHARV